MIWIYLFCFYMIFSFLETCLSAGLNSVCHLDIRCFPGIVFPNGSLGNWKAVLGAAGVHIIYGWLSLSLFCAILHELLGFGSSLIFAIFSVPCAAAVDQPLEQACKYFAEQGIPFPCIGLTDDEKNLKECYMFDGAETPGAPLLLYFPLVNDTFQTYVAPGKLTVPR